MTGPSAGSQGSRWRPATAVEEALRAARARDDATTYRAVIAETALLLPVPEAIATGEQPFRWPAVRVDGDTVAMPAFTSPEALAQSLRIAPHHRAVAFVDLVEHWPDPAWRLAIDPGLPIAAHFDNAALRHIIDTVFAAANEVEAAMLRARRADDPDGLLEALLRAELHLPCAPGSPSRDLSDPDFPWWREAGGSGAVVPAFTSERRLRGRLRVTHGDVDFVIVDLLTLVASWPDDTWTLAVNPGTPMEAGVAGDLAADIATWAREASPGSGAAIEPDAERLRRAGPASPAGAQAATRRTWR